MTTSTTPDLEHVIDSERYKIIKLIGRGCWGSVYSANDTLVGREVAIKVMDPTDIAKKQMQVRQLTEHDAMRKEALDLQPCNNVVPRTFEVDSKGTPFIVMAKYDKFFSDILNDPPFGRARKFGALGEEKPLKTSFFMSDIIDYFGDIINGVSEIHSVYGIAHCDIKPDNLAMDKSGKIAITDMGTSTFTSMGSSLAPRDNMGYVYTRSPVLFVDGEHPKKSADVFAVGSLLYRMFTGKYILQEEIDGAFKNGEEAVKDLMKGFVGKYHDNVIPPCDGTYLKLISKKIIMDEIPKEFRRFIKECVEERYSDGKQMKADFEMAVKQYHENRIEKNKFDEFKGKIKTEAKGCFIGGTMLAAAFVGFTWLAYIGKADFATKRDLETQIAKRIYNKSEAILEIEQPYNAIVPAKGPDAKLIYDNLLKMHQEKHKDDTLIDRIVTEWIKTADETCNSSDNKFGFVDGIDGIPERWRRITPEGRMSGGFVDNYYNEMLRELLPHYFAMNVVGENTIDLEDTLAATLLGSEKLNGAQKAANNFHFRNYITAKNRDGSYVIPENQQVFLKQLLYNISQKMPERVRIKSDSPQPE